MTSTRVAVAVQPKAAGGFLQWLREGTPDARRGLYAASLGWALDGFDVMLYALVITSSSPPWASRKQRPGLLVPSRW